ncbi:hypothetical protein [Brevundimonas poindexterae]|uniref:hypothetical protein n=1 Tax=Brevundimonas poindexterae TaxID=74325 RepID=UPI001CFEDEE1|nr:hypothetical protein [Brevundimonas poindexterae]
MVILMALERELETYNRLLHKELAGEEGRYALIAGSELLGVYDSYSDALTAGYQAKGLAPFLVKKVAAVETVAYFTRDFGAQCTQPA